MSLSTEQRTQLEEKLNRIKIEQPQQYATLASQIIISGKSRKPYTNEQRRLLFAAIAEADKAKRAGRRVLTNPKSQIEYCANNLPRNAQQLGVDFKPVVDRLWSQAGGFGTALDLLSKKYPWLKPWLKKYGPYLSFFGFLHDYLPKLIKDKILDIIDQALTALFLEDSLTDPLSGCLGGVFKIPSFPQLPDIAPDKLVELLENNEQLLLVIQEAFEHANEKNCLAGIFKKTQSLYEVASESSFFNEIDHDKREQIIEASEFLLANLFGYPETAAKFTAVAKETNNLYEVFKQYRFGGATGFVLLGNIASALILLKSTYDWFQGNEEISQEDAHVENIKIMFNELNVAINKGFLTLSNQQKEIFEQLETLKLGQQKILLALDELRKDMDIGFNRLEEGARSTMRGNLAKYRADLLQEPRACQADILKNLRSVKHYACVDSTHIAFTGIDDSAFLSDAQLHCEIEKTNRLHLRFHLLYRLLSRLGITLPENINRTITPNPVEWARACDVYSTTIAKMPDLLQATQVKTDIKAIWEVGRWLMNFVHKISDRDFIIDKLMKIYLQQADALNKKITSIIAKAQPTPIVSNGGRDMDLTENFKFRAQVMKDPQLVLKDGCEAEILSFEQAAIALLACWELNILRQTTGDTASQPLGCWRGTFNRAGIYEQIKIGAKNAGAGPHYTHHVDKAIAARLNMAFARTAKSIRYDTATLLPEESLPEITLPLTVLSDESSGVADMWPELAAPQALIYQETKDYQKNSQIQQCQFSKDGRYLLINGGHHDVSVYQTSNWQSEHFPHLQTRQISGVAFSPSDMYVFIGNTPGGWSFVEHAFKGLKSIGCNYMGPNANDKPPQRALIRIHGDGIIKFCTYSTSGRWVAVTFSHHYYGEVDINDESCITTFTAVDRNCSKKLVERSEISGEKAHGNKFENYRINYCTFSTNEKWFVACGSFAKKTAPQKIENVRAVTIWDTADWKKPPREKLEQVLQGGYSCCAFSPDDRFLVAAGLLLKIWSTSDWSETYQAEFDYAFCVFSPDNQYLLTALNRPHRELEKTEIHVRSASTFQILKKIQYPGTIRCIDVSPDSSQVSICGKDIEGKAQLSVWDSDLYLRPTTEDVEEGSADYSGPQI